MKKIVIVILCLLCIVCLLYVCINNGTKGKKTPSNSYEKVLFALDSVTEAMKNPTLNDEDTMLAVKNESALSISFGVKSTVIGDIISKSSIQPVSSSVKSDILSMCFENERTLENAFDTKIVEYIVIFMEAIGESWDENTVYSTSVSGTLNFDFDTFTTGDDSYPYEMDFLMQVQLDENGIVDITIGFDVTLNSNSSTYGFSRYSEIKISSTYDINSNDFTLELSDCEDYTSTPSEKSFVSYEKIYIEVKNNIIQSYEDYSAQTDERIVLDATHSNWQAYFDAGTRFFDHAKVFDGNKVYQSYTNFSQGKAISTVYKDDLMTCFVDEVGLHEAMNDAAFFDSNTLDTDALKTAESKMSESLGKPFVYTLLEHLDSINLDVENTTVLPSDGKQPAVDEKKSVRFMKVVNEDGVEVEIVRINKSVTIEDLLMGRANCYDYIAEGDDYFKIRIQLEYTDNTIGYLDSLTGYTITINDQSVLDFSQNVLPEEGSAVLIIYGSENNISAVINVQPFES
ncbi:MAG: hypothetical protein PHW00_06215 [Clostridia bacterium]|nr:hypothetical protein [Clostridia bacterium]